MVSSETAKSQSAEPIDSHRHSGAPKGSKNALKHGYYSLIKLVRVGRGTIDKRTILGKWVAAQESSLVTALGGDPSPQEQMLIEDVALTSLFIKSVSAHLASLKGYHRRGKVHPGFQLRSQLIAERREHLKLLGLKRVAKTLSLHEILAKEEDNTPDNPNGYERSPRNAESGRFEPNDAVEGDEQP
jgi:hypothetical protein